MSTELLHPQVVERGDGETSTSSETKAAAQAPTERALLILELDGQLYGLPIGSVDEVLRMVAIVALPEGPEWIVGTLNARGRVLPVVDLRARLGLPSQPYGLNTPIVVVTAAGRSAALVADRVIETLIAPAEPYPLGDELSTAGGAVTGILPLGDSLVTILDPERLCPWPNVPASEAR